jgi:hypothetical protein
LSFQESEERRDNKIWSMNLWICFSLRDRYAVSPEEKAAKKGGGEVAKGEEKRGGYLALTLRTVHLARSKNPPQGK